MRNTKPHKTKKQFLMATEPERKITMTNFNTTSNTTANAATIASNVAKFFVCDHFNRKIIGTEQNFKKSGVFGSEQYNALMEVMAAHPTYSLTVKASEKKVEKKQTYKGLNFEMMMDYVAIKGNEVQKAEFEAIVDSNANYPTIKSWFVENFKVGFSVAKAEREIAESKLKAKKAAIRATVRTKVVKVAPANTVEMPAVSNF